MEVSANSVLLLNKEVIFVDYQTSKLQYNY